MGAIKRGWQKTAAFFRGLYKASAINQIVNKITDGVRSSVKRSRFVAWLSNYALEKETKHESFFYHWLIERPSKVYQQIRFFCMDMFERSFFAAGLQSISDILFSTTVHSYAVGLLAGGIMGLTISTTLYFAGSTPTLFDNGFFVAGFLTVFGFSLFFCNDSLSKAMHESIFLRRFLVHYVSVRQEWFKRTEIGKNRYVLTILLGVSLSISVTFLPVSYVLIAIVAVVALSFVIKAPEAGVFLTLLLFPFVSTRMLVIFSVVTQLSFFVKILRGKRVLKFQALDLCVLAFGVATIYGGVFSATPKESFSMMLSILCLLGMYFIVANTMYSKKWTWTAVCAFYVSGTAAVLIGLLRVLADALLREVVWSDTSLFAAFPKQLSGVFSSAETYGSFLVLLLPLSAVMLSRTSGWRKLFCLGGFLTCVISIAMTMSRSVWIAAAISFGLFLIISGKDFFKFMLFCIILSPVFPVVFTSPLVAQFASASNTPALSEYKATVWQGGFRILKDFWPAGIGLGTDAFQKVYPKYAVAAVSASNSYSLYLDIFIGLGILGLVTFLFVIIYMWKLAISSRQKMLNHQASIVILALVLGITGMLIQGVSQHVWLDQKMFLIFFMLIGLAGALRRGYYEDVGEEFD